MTVYQSMTESIEAEETTAREFMKDLELVGRNDVIAAGLQNCRNRAEAIRDERDRLPFAAALMEIEYDQLTGFAV